MSRFLEWLLRLRPGELAGADSWAPSFAAEYNNWVILGLSVALLALAAVTVFSYLREGDHPRRVKLTIAGLRIAVVLLLLAVLFEPGLVLRYRRNVYSSVVVLLDDSLSMSLKDPYADADVREALAGKLGVDQKRLAEMSRVEIVRRLLARQGGPLAELGREHPLVLLRFSTTKRPYTRELQVVDHTADSDKAGQVAAAIAEELSGALAQLSAEGYRTDLATALRAGASRVQGGRVAALVLISDGQDTGQEGAVDRLRSALAHVRQRGIPVFAIGVGDPEPPQNVALLRLQGPQEARQGSKIELTAYLTHRNCDGQTVEVRLLRRPAAEEKWTEVALDEPARVELTAQPAEKEVKLLAKAEGLGQFVYKAEVAPLAGEFSTKDNAATTKLRISEERMKVLLVSGDAGWEFQYLRNFFLRSPERYAVSVWQQDADVTFNQEASTGMKLTRLPQRPPELFNYEVVILYDPAYTKEGFDKTFVDMLGSFVADHHGGLCYIASNKHTDENLTSRNETFKSLAELLPVKLAPRAHSIAERIVQGEPTPWPVVPWEVGLDHPALRLGRNDRENLAIWRALPGVYWWHPVIQLKPAASSLAISGDPLSRTLDGIGEPSPLIAVQYYGKGRSLYIGFDETWRWRFLDDGRHYRKFWSNAVDFLGAGKFQKKRITISIPSGSGRFRVGEDIRIRVEAYDRNYQPLDQEIFLVELLDAATKATVEKIRLEPVKRKARGGAARPPGGRIGPGRDEQMTVKGQFEATYALKTLGTFELTAKRNDPLYKDDVAGKTITVTLPEEEFRHPEADLKKLQTIAPDRHFLMIQDSDGLAEMIPSGKMSVFHDVPRLLWDVPLTMVVIVALLAIEWILRKKYNMA